MGILTSISRDSEGLRHKTSKDSTRLIGAFGDERNSPRTARMLVFPADRQV